MALPDKLTFSRIILAPLFFAVYFLDQLIVLPAAAAGWIVALLWVIFFVSEITDMLDGMTARRMGLVSDFGKLFDPFADTLMQITCFLCFVLDGIFPAALLLVVVYREFGISFMRNLMLKKGIAMGARMGGKIKTVTYIAASALALLYISFIRLGVLESLSKGIRFAAVVVFVISVVFSILSFMDYLRVYRAAGKNTSEKPAA